MSDFIEDHQECTAAFDESQCFVCETAVAAYLREVDTDYGPVENAYFTPYYLHSGPRYYCEDCEPVVRPAGIGMVIR